MRELKKRQQKQQERERRVREKNLERQKELEKAAQKIKAEQESYELKVGGQAGNHGQSSMRASQPCCPQTAVAAVSTTLWVCCACSTRGGEEHTWHVYGSQGLPWGAHCGCAYMAVVSWAGL